MVKRNKTLYFLLPKKEVFLHLQFNYNERKDEFRKRSQIKSTPAYTR